MSLIINIYCGLHLCSSPFLHFVGVGEFDYPSSIPQIKLKAVQDIRSNKAKTKSTLTFIMETTFTNIFILKVLKLNTMVEWLGLLLCFREVRGSDVDPETGSHD
jgi:hypothetical protein